MHHGFGGNRVTDRHTANGVVGGRFYRGVCKKSLNYKARPVKLSKKLIIIFKLLSYNKINKSNKISLSQISSRLTRTKCLPMSYYYLISSECFCKEGRPVCSIFLYLLILQVKLY